MTASADTPTARALLITGTVGAGKTTVADALGDLLTEQKVPHAVIDLDWLRRAWPSPPEDRFQHALTMRNLNAVATNFRNAGAKRLILAGVLETRAEREDHEAALGIPLTVCRLKITPAAVRTRLHHRHATSPAALTWHLNRAAQLAQTLETAALEDYSIDASNSPGPEIATQILARW